MDKKLYALIKKVEASGGGGSGGTVDAYTKTQTDNLLLNKVDKNGSKVLSDNNYSDDEKAKLESLENYELPTATLNVLGGVKTTSRVTSNVGFLATPIIDGVPYYKNTTYSEATTTTAGLMSTADKSKLAGLENYDDTQVKNDIAINKSSIGMSRRNLINHNVTSGENNGITYTVNADKSITVNGKPLNGLWQITLHTITTNGNYILTGCPKGGSGTTYMFSLRCTKIDDTVEYIVEEGNGLNINFDGAKYKTIAIRLQVTQGTTVSNLTFYPMLRYADVADDTYEPYTPDLQAQITDLQGKNADSGWTTVDLATATTGLTFDSLVSNWINYRKIGSIVYVRASMKFTAVSDENIVMENMTGILPDTFKPKNAGITMGRCGVYTSNNNSDFQPIYWQFNPSGSVSISLTNNQKLSTAVNKSVSVQGMYFID